MFQKIWKKEKPPIDPTKLARTYTRDEVLSLMSLMAGCVIGGDLIVRWEINEDPQKITVTVDFGEEEDTWDFYKAAALEKVPQE